MENSGILSKIAENCQKNKGVLELCWAAAIKPRKIEGSVFFLLDHNGQTRVYRLVSDQQDERLWRKRDFPMSKLTRVKCVSWNAYRSSKIVS